MNGVMKEITPAEMAVWVEPYDLSPSARSVLLGAGASSVPLYAGTYEDRLVCLAGLIPQTFLANDAYLWLWTPNDALVGHQVKFGRAARKWVRQMLTQYSTLIGDCTPASARWLSRLGARLYPVSPNHLRFEIKP